MLWILPALLAFGISKKCPRELSKHHSKNPFLTFSYFREFGQFQKLFLWQLFPKARSFLKNETIVRNIKTM